MRTPRTGAEHPDDRLLDGEPSARQIQTQAVGFASGGMTQRPSLHPHGRALSALA